MEKFSKITHVTFTFDGMDEVNKTETDLGSSKRALIVPKIGV
jgi:hypothetical protein